MSIECVGDRQRPTAANFSGIGRLLVYGKWVMATGRNPCIVKETLKRRTIGTFQDIEMHRMFRPLDLGWSHKGGIPQGLRVGGGDGATPNIMAVEVWKFCPKNGGLKFIESRVSSGRETDIAFLPSILPKHPERIRQS